MLIDTQYISSKKKLACSYIDKEGTIKFKYYDWDVPFKIETCDPRDKDVDPLYKSWDGQSIKKVQANHPDRYAVYEFIDALPQKEQEELFEYNEPNVYFLDIETEILDGFPSAEEAENRVLSISIVHGNKIVLTGLEEMSQEVQKRIIDNTNKYFKEYGVEYTLQYIKFNDEFDMLYTFFEKMVPKMALLTGWNFISYDWVYLVNRCRKIQKEINGKIFKIDPAVSSPTKTLDKVWLSNEEVPRHRMIFDYMQLYAALDTSVKIKESNSLDFVSQNVLGLTKIKNRYDENPKTELLGKNVIGSLKQLYENDFETFMYYNCVDSVLVKKIHDKMNYISILYAISSLSRIKLSDVFNTNAGSLASLAITEGVLRGRFREMENIILFKDQNKKSTGSGIAGGWVKEPKRGMNKWVMIYDFASLYPSTQIQFYIAPENYVGKQLPNEMEYAMNEFGKKVLIDKEKMVVCTNGTVFLKRESPTICMLKDVYSDRKKNKKIMMEKKKELDIIKKEIEQLEKEL
jgi:DNA polymerase elongation subunit (family B)